LGRREGGGAGGKWIQGGLALAGPGVRRGLERGGLRRLLKIKSELGASIGQVETKTPPEFEAGFRDFAAQGYNLVFGHGFEFQDAAAKVGAEFPKTVFITTSGSTVKANVSPMVFRLEEATYLLGMTAALMSKSGKAALVAESRCRR